MAEQSLNDALNTAADQPQRVHLRPGFELPAAEKARQRRFAYFPGKTALVTEHKKHYRTLEAGFLQSLGFCS
jgi:hypothetical protein